MFLCVLLGGMTVALTIGLLDVLTIHGDVIKSQGKADAGVDLALGLLLAVGGLLATGRLHGRQRTPVPAGTGPDKPEKKDGWAQRVLAEPRLGLAMLVGALVGLPGASYLTALHHRVPSGLFNLTARVYQPEQAMLDGHTENNLVVQAGTYQIPPIQKVSDQGYVSQISGLLRRAVPRDMA
jgi:hypothetical protein